MDIHNEVLRMVRSAASISSLTLPGGISEPETIAFESRTKLIAPAELKEWLLTCNGINVEPGGLYGITPAERSTDIEYIMSFQPEWRNNQWIPVASDGCGSYYVLDTQSSVNGAHPVYFTDRETDASVADYIVASGLWKFLRFLLKDQLILEQGGDSYWPFDRKRVLKEDPALAAYSGNVPLPWLADKDGDASSLQLLWR